MSRRYHEELQKKICFICFKKTEIPISPKSKELIAKFVHPEFYQDEDFLPKSLCPKCQRTLSSLQTPKPRPLMYIPNCKKLVLNVKDNQRVKTLRGGKEKPCSCEICRLGLIPKISNLKCFDAPIESDFFISYGQGSTEVEISMAEDDGFSPCGFCSKNNIAGHECNAERIIQSISLTTSEIIATEIIKQKMIKKNSRDVELKCKHGPQLHVTCTNLHVLPKVLHGSSTTQSPISNSTFMKLRSQLNLSGRKAVLATRLLKKELGIKLEPYFQELLIKKGHELDSFFDYEEMEFESSVQESVGKGKKVRKLTKRVVVYCLNIEDLVKYIMVKREYESKIDELLVKIGLDSGRGFLKLCMTVEEDEKTYDKKTASKFKDSGVKRLLIIAIAEKIPETYQNVKKLINQAGLNTLTFSKSMSIDLKMVNIVLGKEQI